ncbi:winged helix-turn-helix domain-containing protein [Enterococcus gilvus]|uniref:winged helix-turn-helix domain-containing protein n=1 Tax=Enterococcus gilvus TaxID=160453 RepID=UPI003ED88412
MKPIVLLTKNILFELPMQQKIQKMDYELFCSSDLLENWLSSEAEYNYVQLFSAIFVSETITKSELRVLLLGLKEYGLPVIRLTETTPETEEKAEWQRLGISSWLLNDCAAEELRETIDLELLSRTPSTSIKQLIVGSSVYLEGIKLSEKENELLSLLVERPNQAVPREELSETIWGKTTNSTKAQLSLLTAKINSKFKHLIPDAELVKTLWGQGYFIEESCCSLIKPCLLQ